MTTDTNTVSHRVGPTRRWLSSMLAATLAVPLTGAAPDQAPPKAESEAPAARSASDEPSSVLILIQAPEGESLTDMYRAAREAIERETALVVQSLEAFRGGSAAMAACAGDPKCFADKARNEGVPSDLVLTISAGRLEDSIGLSLRLLDMRAAQAGKSAELSKVSDEIPAGVSLERVLKDYVAKVFPASIWGQVSSLAVEVEQDNAEVNVSGRSCLSPCRIERIRPGTYDVTVNKSGYKPFTKKITLNAREPGSVKVALEAEETSGFAGSPLFWGVIGAGAVAAGVVTFLLLRPSDGPVTICIAKEASLCQ